ncbi:hypothetical protein BDZ97DRAFT_1757514 [Flammula alnicola]|nr:hypothetical protein BDZ97DRAFT_1757514 [Flammula alnicola]
MHPPSQLHCCSGGSIVLLSPGLAVTAPARPFAVTSITAPTSPRCAYLASLLPLRVNSLAGGGGRHYIKMVVAGESRHAVGRWVVFGRWSWRAGAERVGAGGCIEGVDCARQTAGTGASTTAAGTEQRGTAEDESEEKSFRVDQLGMEVLMSAGMSLGCSGEEDMQCTVVVADVVGECGSTRAWVIARVGESCDAPTAVASS